MMSLRDLLNAPGDRPVCIDGDTVIRLSQFQSRVATLASRFSSMQATRYALCLTDSYDFACAFFALLAASKLPVIPANATPGHLASIAASFDIALDSLTAFEHDAPATLMPRLASDARFVLYTSGTSGTPKAIVKHLHDVDTETGMLETKWGVRLGSSVVLGCVPHQHFFGLIFQILWPLAAGRAFDRMRHGRPDELAARMRTLGACAIVATPAQLIRWPMLDNFDAMRPVSVMCAGSPLDAQHAGIYTKTFGFAPDEIFGSTETGALASRRHDEHDAWTLLPGIEARADEQGALNVVIAGQAQEYATPDRVRFDADGRFHLLGRMDRIVKVDGARVSLAELEARMASHPYVAGAAAVLLAKGRARDRVGAVIVLSEEGKRAWRDSGRRTVTAQLVHHLAGHVPVMPRLWRFRSALPFDDRGKLPSEALAREFDSDNQLPDIYAEIAERDEAVFDLHVPASLVHFAGHFPGMPILPGVVQIDWAMRLAARHFMGDASMTSIERLKFLQPVRPGALMTLTLQHEAARSRVRFEYRVGGRPCASGVIDYAEVSA